MANYGTVPAANDYFTAKLDARWTGSEPVKLAALVRGSAYIDGRYRCRMYSGRWSSMFPGRKTGGYAQPLEWPRTGATDYEGSDIPDNVTPLVVEQATYEAALQELISPGSLSPIFIATEQVKREKVGPIEVEYVAASSVDGSLPNLPMIPLIDWIIAPVVRKPAEGIAIAVV